jgi:hypothetical protein
MDSSLPAASTPWRENRPGREGKRSPGRFLKVVTNISAGRIADFLSFGDIETPPVA